MSKNINQVFISNPATAMEDDDLFYLGRSPYGLTNDMAILWSDVVISLGNRFLRVANNFTDVANPETAFKNLGTGTGLSITITDGDFTLGVYQIALPFPAQVVCNNLNGIAQQIRVPVANTPFDSPSLGQGPIIKMIDCVATDIALSDGTVIDNLSGFEQSKYIAQDKSTAAGAYTILPEVYFVNSVSGRIELFSPENTVYVGTSTSTGAITGSITNPYPDLETAIAAITTASSLTPFKIEVSTGTYSITDLILKPWIYIDLNNSALTVTNSIVLDSSWSGISGNSALSNGLDCVFPATVTLDFDAIGATFSYFQLSNITSSTSTTQWNITGASGGSVFLAGNNVGFGGAAWSYNVDLCFGGIANGSAANIVVTDSPFFAIENIVSTGTTLLTTLIASVPIQHRNCTCVGAVSYTASGSTTITIIARGNSYLGNPITLDNGVSGGNVILDIETLEELPILLNGATYTPTSISDAMNANVNFTPVNYTPMAGGPGLWTAESVTGNLAGIDAAIAGTVGNVIKQQLWVNFTDGLDTNQGGLNDPFKTYDAATAFAALTSSPTNRFLIRIIGDLSLAGDLNIRPFIDLNFQDSIVTVSGSILLDASFTVSDEHVLITGFRPICSFINLQWASNAEQNNVITFLNPNFSRCGAALFQGNGSSVNKDNAIAIFNDINPLNTTFLSGCTVTNVKSRIVGVNFGGDLNYSLFDDDYNIDHYLSDSYIPGNLIVNRPSGNATQRLRVRNCLAVNPIQLDTQNGGLYLDSNSYSQVPILGGSNTFADVFIYNSTDGIIENTFTPVHYSFVAGNYSLNALTGYLKGIDTALTGVTPSEAIYVDGINGNDSNTGSIVSPLLTYEAARLLAVSRNPQYASGQTIIVMTTLSITGDMTINPYVSITGFNKASTIIGFSGNMVLDALWGTTDFGGTIIKDIAFVSNNGINFVFPAFQDGAIIRFQSCSMQFGTNATFTGSDGSGNARCETIILDNCSVDLQTGIPEPQFISDNVNLILFNTSASNSVSSSVTSTTVASTLIVQNALGITGNITVNAASTGTLSTQIAGCNTSGSTLTVNGTSNTVNIDADSYKFVNFVFSGSAGFSNIISSSPFIIYVDQVSGSDSNSGSINYPLKNYETARLLALSRGVNAILPSQIIIIGTQDITGSFTISPFVNVRGLSQYSCNIIFSTTLELSAEWGIDNAPATEIKDLYIYSAGGVYSLTYPAYQPASFLKFVNCGFNTGATFTITGSGASSGGGVEQVIFNNCTNDILNYTLNYTLENITAFFINNDLSNSTLTHTVSATDTNCTLTINNCQYYSGDINLITSSTSTLITRLTATNTAGYTLTIDGNLNTVIVDSTSYMFTLALTGGATLANLTLPTKTDGMTNSSYTPINYTPTAGTDFQADSLTGNLKGIDAELGLLGGRVISVLGTEIIPTEVYTSGTTTLMWDTFSGTNTVSAFSLGIGQTVEMTSTGSFNSISPGGQGFITFNFGALVSVNCQPIFQTTTFQAQYEFRARITRIDATRIAVAITGWYNDSSTGLTVLNMYVDPFIVTYDETVNNDMTLTWSPIFTIGSFYGISATLNIIQYN